MHIHTDKTKLSTTQSWKIVFTIIGIAVIGISALQIIRAQFSGIPSGVLSAQIKPAEGIESVKDLDSDGDGLFDAQEELLGTNPFNADTDNDGFTDGEEVFNGYNPLSASLSGKLDDSVKIFGEPQIIYDALEAQTKVAYAQKAGIGGSAMSYDDVLVDSSAMADMLRQTNNTVVGYTLPDVSNFNIKAVNANGKTAVENYFYAMLGTFSKYAPFTNESDMSEFITEVQMGNYDRVPALIEAKEKGLQELENIEVPAEALEIHKQGLGIVLGGSDALLAMKGVGGEGTQEETLILFSQIQFLLDQTDKLVSEITSLSKKYDLPLIFE